MKIFQRDTLNCLPIYQTAETRDPKEIKISLKSHARRRKEHQPGRELVSLEEILEFQQLVSTLQNETEALTRTGSRMVAGLHLS